MIRKKKKQHYVPQFYLRNFSCNDGDKKKINIYNVNNNRFIENVPIKTQAQENYFYGEDERLEDVLGDMENVVAPIIHKIIENNKVPDFHSVEYIDLIVFILFSLFRTKKTIENFEEIVDKSLRNILRHHKDYSKMIDDGYFGYENSAAHSLKMAYEGLPFVYRLKLKIIKNESNIDFATCDNPVIIYNQFLESRKVEGGISGLAMKGVMLFLPISSRSCIFLYDYRMYKVGFKRDEIIFTKNENDIKSINTLSLLNSNQNVFYSDASQQKILKELALKAERYIKPGKIILEETDLPVDETGKKRLLIDHYQTSLRIGMKLSFVRETKKAKKL